MVFTSVDVEGFMEARSVMPPPSKLLLPGDRAVNYRQRSEIVFNAPARVDAFIAGESAVGHGQRSPVVFDPASLTADIV